MHYEMIHEVGLRPMIKHKCHAPGCTKATPRHRFMCQGHWWMLPPKMQRDIKKHYQMGQEKGEIRPSPEYLEAARVAKTFVEKKEGGR